MLFKSTSDRYLSGSETYSLTDPDQTPEAKPSLFPMENNSRHQHSKKGRSRQEHWVETDLFSFKNIENTISASPIIEGHKPEI